METTICSKCDQIKVLSEFTKNKAKKEGYNNYCKQCNKEYQKTHYENNKIYYIDKKNIRKESIKNFINRIKRLSQCSKCSEKDIACLDFHHVNDLEKDFNISIALQLGVSMSILKKELRKCIILCSNCHRKLHYYK